MLNIDDILKDSNLIFKEKHEENILKKINNQIVKEKIIKENYKIYDISFVKYNEYVLNKKIFKPFYSFNNTDENNHVIGALINVFNKAHLIFPSFYPFFYEFKQTGEFIFEDTGINTTLKTFFDKCDDGEIKSAILKAIFYHLHYLNQTFNFTFFNISLKDFLISSSSSTLFPIKKFSSKEFSFNKGCLENFSISFNPSSIVNTMKNCVFSINKNNLSEFYGTVSKVSIKENITKKLIKIDRPNLLTDIFCLLKESNLLHVLVNGDVSRLNKCENLDIFPFFSFEKFIENNLNEKLTYILENRIVSHLTEHDEIWDYIENNKFNLDDEFLIIPVENYIKDFDTSYFYKNIINFCNKEINNQNIEFLKINFYIFCKLKNYYFSNDKKEINSLFKKHFLFLYNKVK